MLVQEFTGGTKTTVRIPVVRRDFAMLEKMVTVSRTKEIIILISLISVCQAVKWLDVSSRLRSIHLQPTQSVSSSLLASSMMKYRRSGDDLDSILHISSEESIERIDTTNTIEGTKVSRFYQKYKGIPIYDATFTVESDQESGELTGQATGKMADNLDTELPSVQPNLTEDKAYHIAFQHFGTADVRRKRISVVVFCPEIGNASIAYKLSFFGIKQGILSRPTYFIDGNTGHILKYWDTLSSYRIKGIGGNQKTGKLLYGLDLPYLQVDKSNSQCVYQNKDVIVFDLNSAVEFEEGQKVAFDCASGAGDETNGGFSPATDAYYLGIKATAMYKSWMRTKPCQFMPLEMYVHYGHNKTDAFFDGASFYFGDGRPSVAYPFVVPDVVAHEIAHCFTESHSALEYSGQSGGLDESFSDLAGEAFKMFIFGANDWKAGSALLPASGAVRELCDQSEDGKSITHVKDYIEDMDVHHLSGVFNKVSCTLAKSEGWGVQSVFQVFSHANRFYWHPTSDFQDAGCGILKAAYDLGHPMADVRRVLQSVGLKPCSVDNYIRRLPLPGRVTNLNAKANEQILLRIYNSNKKSKYIYVATSGGEGDVDIHVGMLSNVTPDSAILSSTRTGNDERVDVFMRKLSEIFILLVPKSSSFTGITIRTRGI